MTMIGAIILGGVLVLAVLFWRHHDTALAAHYLARPTRYREWLKRYGKIHKPEFQRYLRCFGDAFFVSPAILHKFAPDDGILDYYKEDYRHGGPDFLEAVHFARGLHEQFGYELKEEDGSLTMGQLFEKVTRIQRMESPNNTPDGICQPADGLPKPSV